MEISDRNVQPGDTGRITKDKGVVSSSALCGFKEIFEDIKAGIGDDCSYWHILGFVDNPLGDKQSTDSKIFDHEYVDQYTQGMDGDFFTGHIYLPFGDKYLQIEYTT